MRLRPILALAVLWFLGCAVQRAPGQREYQTNDEHAYAAQLPPPTALAIDHPRSAEEKNASDDEQNESLYQRMCSALVANWPFVLVGIAGVWAALRTLSIIEEQTAATAQAARAAADNAEIAKENLRLIMSKERGRLYLDYADLNITNTIVGRKDNPYGEHNMIRFTLGCSGTTDASIEEGYIETWFANSFESSAPDKEIVPLLLPDRIRPNEPEKREIPANSIPEVMVDILSPEKFKTGIFLHFQIVIKYTDVFQTKTYWEMTSHDSWDMRFWIKEIATADRPAVSHAHQHQEREIKRAS
jgi:hypothetical protein